MAEFPHLTLSKRIKGSYRHRGGGNNQINERTQQNLNNRQQHANSLIASVDILASQWEQSQTFRKESGFPDLPNSDIIPVFLQVDPDKFDIESLKGFGIEIISEEDDGFIIGSSSIDFNKLRNKIERFVNELATNPAQLWQINDGSAWRIEQILSESLKARWEEISDEEILTLDISIACYKKVSSPPIKGDEISDEEYSVKYDRWLERKRAADIERDEMAMQRQVEFEQLVRNYQGELLESYIDYEDSFTCRINLSGVGLKDIVLNYPFVFEVSEPENIAEILLQDENRVDLEIQIEAPDPESPKICVIDSGIEEGHALISDAIINSRSLSYLKDDPDVFDKVAGGGHGTRVAGAILFPDGVIIGQSYKLPFYLINARVLDNNNNLPLNLYPPALIKNIVTANDDVRVFNLSITSRYPCRLTHMSPFAAMVDKMTYENDILFIVAAGNISRGLGQLNNPGILHHINGGDTYPEYLLHNSSRVANPAQSCFALTVGSICLTKYDDPDRESFGDKDFPSSFSRSGPGIWGMIKPDVVEYGGDWIREKNNNPNLSTESITSPELVKARLTSASGIGRDAIGTSFAAPKVTFIAGELQKLFPNLSSLTYRALIVQSARWPDFAFNNPETKWLRHFGYGIPSVNRGIENSENRITFISEGEIDSVSADIYSVKIPDAMRRQGDDYNILIEVTLSFKADIRRTRRKTKSYLSSWLTWESSYLNDDFDRFSNRVLKNIEQSDETENEEDSRQDNETIKWTIRENKKWPPIDGFRRQDSSIQKDWVVISSYNLPAELSFAVVGHKGWEKDFRNEIPYSIAVSFEVLGQSLNIYEMLQIENEVTQDVRIEV
jgi:hypothetical protein